MTSLARTRKNGRWVPASSVVDYLFLTSTRPQSKYTKSLTEHNKTLNEMSKELAQLRESHNIYKNKLRDMELDNDELENAERMVRSSLNDIEQRYNQQMEKAALLEQEVIDKSHLEEDNQRLRDEIRGA